jgi:hypothetical protein
MSSGFGLLASIENKIVAGLFDCFLCEVKDQKTPPNGQLFLMRSLVLGAGLKPKSTRQIL